MGVLGLRGGEEVKTRGMNKIADLERMSERRSGSDCWWYLGAKSCDGRMPRIWAFCHDQGKKRVLSGPRAVWNIAHNEGLGVRIGYMRCVNTQCVNPVHVAAAYSRAEIGSHISRSDRIKGQHRETRMANLLSYFERSGKKVTPDETVVQIRAMTGTNLAIAEQFGLRHQVVSSIRRGKSFKHLLPVELQAA